MRIRDYVKNCIVTLLLRLLINLNTFLNNNKIPNIPSNVNGKIISNFDKKLKLFKLHFASQCAPINNSSVVPPLDY